MIVSRIANNAISRDPKNDRVLMDCDTEKCMPSCEHCGGHISERFERVFGDNTGTVYACVNCSATAGIGEVTSNRSKEHTDSATAE